MFPSVYIRLSLSNTCTTLVVVVVVVRRDVRLRSGFVNLEPLPQGGFKQKIPEKLLHEKRRTQDRFKNMRKKSGSESKVKEKRSTSIMTKRIHNMLQVIPIF